MTVYNYPLVGGSPDKTLTNPLQIELEKQLKESFWDEVHDAFVLTKEDMEYLITSCQQSTVKKMIKICEGRKIQNRNTETRKAFDFAIDTILSELNKIK